MILIFVHDRFTITNYIKIFIHTIIRLLHNCGAVHRMKALKIKPYSNSNDWLMGLDVFSVELNLCGKIDLYNKKTKNITGAKAVDHAYL